MRIAVVHNLPPGGARRRIESQVARLRFEVVEICLSSGTPVTQDPIVIPLQVRAAHYSTLFRPPLRYADEVSLEIAWARAAAAIKRTRADVLYLNPCRFLQAPPVLGRDAPPALYFCDEPRRVDSEDHANASRRRTTRPLYGAIYARQRRLDRMTTARAARIATNSRYTAAEIQRVYSRSAQVVTMGVAEGVRDAAPVGVDDGFILTVGSLIPSKGHDLAIRAAAAASGRPPVVLVAPRPDLHEERRLRALARDLGIDLQVRVGISDPELGRLYGRAHATLYLARSEPLGLVSLEAQACGSPVIVAAEGGLPDTIMDGVTGWQTPRDAQSVAALLDRLLDSDLRDRMSREARKHGRSWNWDRSAAEIEQLLADVNEDRAGR